MTNVRLRDELATDPVRFGWPVKDWCAATGLGRTLVYEFMAEGQIESVKVGAKRLITTHPRDFLNSLKGSAS